MQNIRGNTCLFEKDLLEYGIVSCRKQRKLCHLRELKTRLDAAQKNPAIKWNWEMDLLTF